MLQDLTSSSYLYVCRNNNGYYLKLSKIVNVLQCPIIKLASFWMSLHIRLCLYLWWLMRPNLGWKRRLQSSQEICGGGFCCCSLHFYFLSFLIFLPLTFSIKLICLSEDRKMPAAPVLDFSFPGLRIKTR